MAGDVDAIYVLGGDGTYNEVLNGVVLDVPLGFLPGESEGRASSRARSAFLGTRSRPLDESPREPRVGSGSAA